MKSKELCDDLCEYLANGGSLRSWCEEEGNPSRNTVIRWLSEDPEFRDQYARAREAQADFWAEQIIEIADDTQNDWKETERGEVPNETVISRSRLMVDTRKWLMARMKPKVYGDRVQNEVSGEVNVNVAAQGTLDKVYGEEPESKNG